MIQRISEVQNMAAKLLDVGEGTSEIMIIAKVLARLPTAFTVFQSAWDSVDS